MSPKLQKVPFSHLAEINPSTPVLELENTAPVSFIPMQDVSESGQWVTKQTRLLNEVKNGYTSFQDDDVLFAKITPCMENGKGCHATGLENGFGFGSTEFHVLRAKPNNSSRFIFHWLQFNRLRLKAEAYMTGSAGQRRVPTNFFEQYLVPLLPELEQWAIAHILDTIDEAIAITTAHIDKLKLTKAGLLHDLLTRGIDDNGEIRDPIRHPEQFKDSALDLIPQNWNVHTIGEISESVIDGPFGSNLKTEHYVAEPGVRVIRLQNIDIGYFDDSDKAFISDAHAKSLSRHDVISGDLLIAGLGDDNHPIARACIYPNNLPSGIHKADCFRGRMNSDLATNDYVMHVLNCPSTRGDVRLLGQGVTRDRINSTTVKTIRLRLPSLQEQVQITKILKTQDFQIQQKLNKKEKLLLLKQGLMSDLLIGQVRVKVDSSKAG